METRDVAVDTTSSQLLLMNLSRKCILNSLILIGKLGSLPLPRSAMLAASCSQTSWALLSLHPRGWCVSKEVDVLLAGASSSGGSCCWSWPGAQQPPWFTAGVPALGPCRALVCAWGCRTGAHLTARGWRTQTPASSRAGGSQGECRSKGKLHGAVSCGSPGRPLQETRRGSAAPGSSLMEQWQVKLKSPVSVVQYL